MLGALGDPVTRVADPPPPPRPPADSAQKVDLTRTLDGGVHLIDLAKHLKGADMRAAFGAVDGVAEEIEKSSAVVLDLRGGETGVGSFFVQHFLAHLELSLVSRSSQAPAERYLMHSGYRPQ